MEKIFAPARRMLGKATAMGVGLAVVATMTAGPAQAAAPSTGLLGTVTDTLEPVTDTLEPVTDTLEPVTDTLEPVTDPVDSGTGTLEPVTDPVDSGTGTLEPVTDPVDSGTGTLEPVTDPVDSGTGTLEPVTDPVDSGTGTVDPVLDPSSPTSPDGGSDPAQAQHDSEAPRTRVAGTPGNNGWLLRRHAVLRVSANESATFRCSLDGKMVKPCEDRVRVTRLGSRTHVFRAAAVDKAGNADRTPAVRVFTVPRNNEALEHSAAWSKRRGRGYFLNSLSVTTKEGAVLSSRARGIKKLALIASTGRGHGSVEVLLGKRVLKTVSLHSKRAQKRRVLPVASFGGKKRGLVRVRVVTAGKPVHIQGIGIAGR